jgi:uncharacterized protein YndB with AHSA1/START domain
VTLKPIRREITVRCDPEHAFRIFTEEMSSWWPLDIHSIAVDDRDGLVARHVVVEPWVGGRIYEEMSDGSTAVWGVIREWDPPKGLRIAWKPNDRPAEQATDISISFAPDRQGTRVTLVHTGWAVLGPDATESRRGYSSGWPGTLERYATAADSAA